MTPGAVEVVTLACREDVAMHRTLCANFDRDFPAPFCHVVYAAEADLPLFADLAVPRRRFAALEALAPRGLRRLPLWPRSWLAWAPPFGLARTSVLRESLQISAVQRATTEVVVLLQNDRPLARPLELPDVLRGARARFYRRPETAALAELADDYGCASRLLGLEPDIGLAGYADVIGVRRRSLMNGLAERIEAASGVAWGLAHARAGAVSEPALYGLYVDHVIGVERAGLFIDRRTLGATGQSGEAGAPVRRASDRAAPEGGVPRRRLRGRIPRAGHDDR